MSAKVEWYNQYIQAEPGQENVDDNEVEGEGEDLGGKALAIRRRGRGKHGT